MLAGDLTYNIIQVHPHCQVFFLLIFIHGTKKKESPPNCRPYPVFRTEVSSKLSRNLFKSGSPVARNTILVIKKSAIVSAVAKFLE